MDQESPHAKSDSRADLGSRGNRRAWFKSWVKPLLRLSLGLLGSLAFVWLLWERGHSLWPEPWAPLRWDYSGAALLLYLPYAWLRALRFGSLWGHEPEIVQYRRLVLCSGWVSFFWLAAVPLRIGELSRPWIWVKRLPPELKPTALDLRMSRALGVTAAERVSDLFCVLLLLLCGGRWLHIFSSLTEKFAHVAGFALLALGLFFGTCAAVLLWMNRKSVTQARQSSRLQSLVAPLLSGVATLWSSPQRLVFWGQTMVYWGITTFQIWLMAKAFHLSLDLGGAAAVVAFVALSIQLPAGPGQVGSYQLGAWAALEHLGAATSGVDDANNTLVSFITAMWLMQLIGSAVMALWGWIRLPPQKSY